MNFLRCMTEDIAASASIFMITHARDRPSLHQPSTLPWQGHLVDFHIVCGDLRLNLTRPWSCVL